MTREELFNFLSSQPTIQKAKSLARKLGLKVKKRMKKQEVYKLLSDYAELLDKSEQKVYSVTSKIQEQVRTVSEIPSFYCSDRLILLAVNPTLVFAFWDLSKSTYDKLAQSGNVILRLYDVTYIEFDGTNAHRIFEAGVHLGMCRNYYFNLPTAGADYLAELGYKTENNFVPVLRSNLCRTPSASPAQTSRQRWYVRGKPQIVTIGESLIKPVEKIYPASWSSESFLSGGGNR